MVEVNCPCGCEMDYIGNGEWECPECGEVLYTGYDDEGDSTAENLSREEAALIWRSRGMDEEDTFGYTQRELERELTE